MTEWLVVTVIISLIGLISPIVGISVKTTKVIQQNTDAINTLTDKIDSLTSSNSKDHEHFHKSINTLKTDVAILQEKHRND